MAQLKLTIASAAQAQITNDDGSGKMSDPERDALVAGKTALLRSALDTWSVRCALIRRR